MKKVIVIAGPTAAGKSDFALELAKRYDTEIISGDSIQVYRGLDIGSGKVTKEEMQGIRHYLIDILSPFDTYNVADFQTMARKLIEEHEKPMIICGGTGLYLKACLYDYVFSQEEESDGIDPELEKLDNDTLYDLLVKADPLQAQKIHPHNRRRVLRSLTIYRRNGTPQSTLESEQSHQLLYDARIIGCTMDRDLLYRRINARVEKMFEKGLQEEVSQLIESGITFDHACMKGIGYHEWRGYFAGESTAEQVKQDIQKHSRQFAKRQYTWFNHQMPVDWYDVTDQDDKKRVILQTDHWLEQG